MKVIRGFFSKFGLAIVMMASLFNVNFTEVIALETGDIVMQVNDAEQKMDLEPLSTYEGSFSVENTGRLPFSVKVYVHPLQASRNGNELNFTDQTAHTAISKWITLEQEEIYLGPGESKAVNYTVNVPEDVPAGGQYAAFEIENQNSADPNDTIRTITSLFVLVYGHVSGETRKGGSLISQEIPSFWLDRAPSTSVTIENTGNIDFEITQNISVYNFFSGKEIFGDNVTADKSNQTVFTIMPDTVREITVDWESAPKIGIFRVTQKISFLEQEYEYDQVIIIMPTFIIVLAIAFVILAILWVILLYLKHKRKRAVL